MKVELVIPVTPTSFNATRTAHWRKVKRAHDALKDELIVALYEAKIGRNKGVGYTNDVKTPSGAYGEGEYPRRGYYRVRASAVLRFPKRRRRDEGNFRAPLEKALGDALQHRGIIADDTPDHFTFGELTFDPEPGPSRTTITMEVS